MPPPTFLGSMGRGGMRRVQCPRCKAMQLVARKPPPYQVACKRCGSPFTVTDSGATTIPKHRAGSG